MAALQKFKLLATQCTIAGSPTRSPTTSPVVHLRRRKTLRMLLTLGGSGRRQDNGSPDLFGKGTGEGKDLVVRQKLKDLFVSGPPSPGDGPSESVREGLLSAAEVCSNGGIGGGSIIGQVGSRSPRPLSATYRQRLLRRVWRPVLMAIPE